MTTRVYKSFKHFNRRKDKLVNGITQETLDDYPNAIKSNETNTGCWECIDCTNCNECDFCVECASCFDSTLCERCERCYNCADCTDCLRCIDCNSVECSTDQANVLESDWQDVQARIADIINSNNGE